MKLAGQGIAFHYGNMPSLLRLEIERLFRNGVIRFLVCTSTLIEGVNLSCRTIVLRGPRKGTGRPMEPHDFWNLAGRAGRWGDEFQGTIICVDPSDTSAWPGGVPDRTRHRIQRESDAVLDRDADLAAYLETRADRPTGELEGAERQEQVGAYLLNIYLRDGSLKSSGLAKRHDPTKLERLDRILARLAGRIEIELRIAVRHPGISAVGLQCLLDAFRRYEGDVENLLPAPVESFDSRDRLATILRRINRCLYPAFMPDTRIPLYALIITQWLEGLSLARIIKGSIDYHERVGRAYKLRGLILETMDLVEDVARYRAPKYLSAYMDVLNAHLAEIGRLDLIDGDADIGMQLEFGVSARTTFSLIKLGLSRMTAVALYEEIARDDLDPEGCIAWVAERADRLEAMGLPAAVRREILAKLRPGEDATGEAAT